MKNPVRLKECISPGFYDLHESIKANEYTHYVLKGGRGGTKSSVIALQILLIMLKDRNAQAIILRKYKTTLRESVYSQMLWAIYQLGLESYFRFKVSPLQIEFIPTKQRIYFMGLNDPQKLKSFKTHRGYPKAIWYEELQEYDGEEEIRSVNQSLARGIDNISIFYSFNPPRSRQMWVNAWVEEIKDSKIHKIHHSTYESVPKKWLGEVFIREAERIKQKDEDSYKHEYLGIPVGYGGSVFKNVKEITLDEETINSFAYPYHGMDFGYTDPFCYIKAGVRGRDVYILDEIYGAEKKTIQIIDEVSEKAGMAYITADCAGKLTIEDLKLAGLNVVGSIKGADSVYYGVKYLQDMDNIYIDPKRTPNAYREFLNYEYKKDKNGNYIGGYVDKDNHSIDALRYALESLMKESRIQFMKGGLY